MGIADMINGGFHPEDVAALGLQTNAEFNNTYPRIMTAMNQAVTPQAQAQLDAAKAVTPGYNDLALGELQRNAPQMSALQGQLDAGQAASDVANLNTYGQQAGQALRATDASANPEYYNTLGSLGGKYQDVLNSVSPNLSAGQQAAVERGTARLNAGGADNSAVSTAEKAQDFGTAHQANVNNFANVINSVSAALPQLRTGLNPINTALGRDSRSSPVAAAVAPVTKPDNTAYTSGQNIWDTLFSGQMQKNQLRAQTYLGAGGNARQDAATFRDSAEGAAALKGI